MDPSAVILVRHASSPTLRVYLLFMDRKPILKILSKSGENGRTVVLTSQQLTRIQCMAEPLYYGAEN